ncbi:hypothetical protein [Paenibacillus sp. 1_12]|uniref:hypothetical protein n=1 Tax=Paenibacillus sp. 1_12 TaxID=1566278 RepID=UPI0011605407|nr:hypothetical protein [Paenibacillus sp. 1_12]
MLWERKHISDSVSVEVILKRINQLVLLGINPLIILGAFWFVKLDSMKLALLPMLGVLTLVLGGILAISISKFQKLDRGIRAAKDQALYNLYRDRLKAIVVDTDGIGWGFHDQLDGMFFEIAQEFGEDVD